MHRSNIVHRDLKLDNIFLSSKEELHVVIGDFGFACNTADATAMKIKCGTPGFMDPEVLKGNLFSTKSDIFSLGCLLYNLITGKLLFSGKNYNTILFKNKFSDSTAIIDATCTNVT